MALSATFTANFSSFYAAVDKADAKLKDFGEGADKVGGRLNRFANEFSGIKIVQEATLMAKAVEEIGGTSKLTEKELQRLGVTANEAVAKMKKLGMDVPENLRKIADETKHANKAGTDWMGTLTKIGGAVGIAFSVDAVVGFVGSVFAAASAVKDLANQWGFSIEAAQKWKGAARDAGVSTEALGKSIQSVTASLEESSPAYDALLENIGLSGETLRSMDMEDAYKEVLKALEAVTDETLQYDLALGILGPSAKQVIGGIRDGLVDATDAQIAMSEETIRRLADAEEAWGKLKDAVIIFSGEMLASVMDATAKMTRSWGTFFTYLSAGVSDVMGGNLGAGSFTRNLLLMDDGLEQVGQTATTTGAAMIAAGNAVTGFAGKAKTTAQILEVQKQKTAALAKAEQDRARAQAALTRDQEAATRAMEAHNKSIDDLINSFSGQGLIEKANLYLKALSMSIPIEQMTAKQKAEINRVLGEAIGAYQALGQYAPQVMYDVFRATEQARAATVGYLGELDKFNFKDLVGGPIDLGAGVGLSLPPPKPGLFDGFGRALAGNVAGAILRAMEGGGNPLHAAGGAIGAALLDPKQSGIGKAIQTGVGKLPGMLGSAVSTALPILGTMIGPAIGALVDKLFGSKGRDAVKDFAASFGGFDALHTKLGTLGAAGEAMWVKLTQGVGRNNLQEAQAAIDEITKALSIQASGLDLAIETAQRYGFTLEELGPALQRQELDKTAQQIYKDWEILNSAGIDTVAITERMSESVSAYVNQALAMGMEVPKAMEPMLRQFAESGKLLDQNGNAIESLEASGINFALTMSEGFKALIDEVKLLTDAISRSLGLAIRNIPSPKITGEVTWDVQPIPGVPERSTHSEPMESYQHGTDGFRNFGDGTPVMLHGWEAVVPRDESTGAFATVPGAGFSTPAQPIQITVVSQLDGREVARNQVKYIPRELVLSGV